MILLQTFSACQKHQLRKSPHPIFSRCCPGWSDSATARVPEATPARRKEPTAFEPSQVRCCTLPHRWVWGGIGWGRSGRLLSASVPLPCHSFDSLRPPPRSGETPIFQSETIESSSYGESNEAEAVTFLHLHLVDLAGSES